MFHYQGMPFIEDFREQPKETSKQLVFNQAKTGKHKSFLQMLVQYAAKQGHQVHPVCTTGIHYVLHIVLRDAFILFLHTQETVWDNEGMIIWRGDSKKESTVQPHNCHKTHTQSIIKQKRTTPEGKLKRL